jgi:superfamily I DNA/RNA helicase
MNKAIELTKEQRAIVDAELVSLAVVACPGSGKTTTAVHRLKEIRRRLADSRGYVALLSYSNVAVETFRDEYRLLSGRSADDDRVVFHTVDSFIATYLLRPHGARVMNCSRAPFVVLGGEPFLSTYCIGSGKDRFTLDRILLDRNPDGTTVFYRKFKGGGKAAVDAQMSELVRRQALRLGQVGGYTYGFGRAWALALLRREPRLAAAVARRFPQILVDEAQDVGSFEAALLDVLANAGSVVSLIGDVHQSIFGFNFATGTYLREFAKREGVLSLPLSVNRRSIPAIVKFSNALAQTNSKPYRELCDRLSGTFYWRYEEKQLPQLMSAWATSLKAERYELSESAVLVRGNSLLTTVSTGTKEIGQSAVKHFAAAAAAREQRGDIAKALEHCANGVSMVVEGLPPAFVQELKTPGRDSDFLAIRRLVWKLLRDPESGIPLASLSAKEKWLPELKRNLESWLNLVEERTKFRRVATWSNRVKSGKLPDGPIVASDFGQNDWSGLRFGTVHSVKGEGIPAVMYLTMKGNLDALVAGTGDEEGRIGFVAATRAQDLLVIAIPKKTSEEVVEALRGLGLQEWGHSTLSTSTTPKAMVRRGGDAVKTVC